MDITERGLCSALIDPDLGALRVFGQERGLVVRDAQTSYPLTPVLGDIRVRDSETPVRDLPSRSQDDHHPGWSSCSGVCDARDGLKVLRK